MIKVETKNGAMYYKSLLLKYEAQKQEALSNLTTYFDNTVGIGEHSDILTEFDKWVTILADAEDKIEVLKNNFEIYTKV